MRRVGGLEGAVGAESRLAEHRGAQCSASAVSRRADGSPLSRPRRPTPALSRSLRRVSGFVDLLHSPGTSPRLSATQLQVHLAGARDGPEVGRPTGGLDADAISTDCRAQPRDRERPGRGPRGNARRVHLSVPGVVATYTHTIGAVPIHPS